jgi:hypothetical protein
MAKNGVDELAAWQVPVGGRDFALKDHDPGAAPCSSGDKDADKARLQELTREIAALHDMFWAARRFRLLVLLHLHCK